MNQKFEEYIKQYGVTYNINEYYKNVFINEDPYRLFQSFKNKIFINDTFIKNLGFINEKKRIRIYGFLSIINLHNIKYEISYNHDIFMDFNNFISFLCVFIGKNYCPFKKYLISLNNFILEFIAFQEYLDKKKSLNMISLDDYKLMPVLLIFDFKNLLIFPNTSYYIIKTQMNSIINGDIFKNIIKNIDLEKYLVFSRIFLNKNNSLVNIFKIFKNNYFDKYDFLMMNHIGYKNHESFIKDLSVFIEDFNISSRS